MLVVKCPFKAMICAAELPICVALLHTSVQSQAGWVDRSGAACFGFIVKILLFLNQFFSLRYL